MLSFVEERDRIFERWVSEVERLLDRHLDRDDAFAAWTNGNSVAEYAAELKASAASSLVVAADGTTTSSTMCATALPTPRTQTPSVTGLVRRG